MFKLVYLMEDIGSYQTFKEAFTELYTRVKAEKCLTYQLLQSIWITANGTPIMFHNCVMLARDLKILNDDGVLI